MMYAQVKKLAVAASLFMLFGGVGTAGAATLIDTQNNVSLWLGNQLPIEDEIPTYIIKEAAGSQSFYGSLDKNTDIEDVFFSLDTNSSSKMGNGFATINPTSMDDAIGSLTVSLTQGRLFGDMLFDVLLKSFDLSKKDKNLLYPFRVQALGQGGSELFDYDFGVDSKTLKTGILSFLLISTTSNIEKVILSSILPNEEEYVGVKNQKGLKELKRFEFSNIKTPCTENCGGGGGGDPNPVPLPGALPLLFSGLAGLGFVAMRRKKTIAA